MPIIRHKKTSDTNMSEALVGATGFEPAAAWSQTRSATGLRYTPIVMQRMLARKCRGDRIRTCGRLVPNQERYRAALHPEHSAGKCLTLHLRVQRYDFFPIYANFSAIILLYSALGILF